jgi:glucosamine--fructose-6-phosphate aminotransferase (isomerizing)
MDREIREAPRVLARFLEESSVAVRRLAARWRRRPPGLVVLVARGSSDNAALYGRYLWEVLLRVPVSLAAPSVVTLYRARPRLRGSWVMALSQSGRSPDVVAFVRAARRAGAFTVAVTNAPGSPLAEAAHEVVPLQAGPERSVAATKTYQAELCALSLFAAEASGHQGLRQAHGSLPDRVAEALAQEGAAAELAGHWQAAGVCVVTGRGYNFATAREAALKLKETASVAAEALSSADFLHGPVALVGPGFPVLLVAAPGQARDHLLHVARLLRRRGADYAVVSSDPRLLRYTRWALAVPGGLPEELTPHVYAVPAYQLSYHLALRKGLDPDRPRGLRKVTRVL